MIVQYNVEVQGILIESSAWEFLVHPLYTWLMGNPIDPFVPGIREYPRYFFGKYPRYIFKQMFDPIRTWNTGNTLGVFLGNTLGIFLNKL